MGEPVENNAHLRGTEYPISDSALGRVRKGVVNIDGVSLSFDVWPERIGRDGGVYWPISLRYAPDAKYVLRRERVMRGSNKIATSGSGENK